VDFDSGLNLPDLYRLISYAIKLGYNRYSNHYSYEDAIRIEAQARQYLVICDIRETVGRGRRRV
jgi:hypothetical protein